MGEFAFPIERGAVLDFMRALGEADDAPSVQSGVAPLTFTMAADHFDPEFPRRPRPGRPWPDARSGATPGFHAEQHFTYHRHPRVGETLTVRAQPGRTWTREGKRGGLLTFTEVITEYLDREGDVVITARRVAVRTERIAA